MSDQTRDYEPAEAGFFMGEKLTREHTLVDIEPGDEDSRTVSLAFSSEAPVERSFGSEVLDHDAESVRLDRLNDGAAVLVNHDPDDVVGVVENARIDGDRKGRATIRFGKSARAQEIYDDVKDGIRRLVSVGYRINAYDISERSGDSDLVRVTDWTPYEISIVSIPADTAVGIGRHEDANPAPDQTIEQKESVMDQAVDTPVVDDTPAFDEAAAVSKIRSDEKRRCDQIRAIAGKYEGLEEAAREAIDNGDSVDAFNARALSVIGEINSQARAKSQHDGEVDLSKKERQSYSLVRLMDAVGQPQDRKAQERAAFELEVSREAVKDFGSSFNVRGQFVPHSLLTGERAVLMAGTPTAAQELVGTDHMASMYIDALRNSSAAMAAGVTYLSGLVGNVDIPRMVSGVTSTWISAEDGDATEDNAVFDQVVLTPKDLACYTEVSRRLLLQSAPSIEGIVRQDLAIAQALGIDLAVLYGTGTSGQPTGIANQTGVGSKTLAGAVPTYAELVDMVATVKGANYPVTNLTWLFNAAMWGSLMVTPRQASGVEGNFVMDVGTSTVVGHPTIVSEQVADGDVILGDFSQVLLGEWGGLEILTDPYTHSLKGRMRYVTFKTVDVAVRHPEAFVVANDGV